MSKIVEYLEDAWQAALDQFGNEITYTEVEPSTYSPTTGGTSLSSTAVTVDAMIGPVSRLHIYKGDAEADDLVMQVRVADLNRTPQVGDTVTYESQVYTVRKILGIHVLSEMILRRS